MTDKGSATKAREAAAIPGRLASQPPPPLTPSRDMLKHEMRVAADEFDRPASGLLLSGITAALGPSMGVISPAALGQLAEALVQHPWWVILLSASIAGWMMGVLSWLITGGRDTTSQVLFIWIVTATIGFSHLHHSITGSAEVLAAIFAGTSVSGGDFLHLRSKSQCRSATDPERETGTGEVRHGTVGAMAVAAVISMAVTVPEIARPPRVGAVAVSAPMLQVVVKRLVIKVVMEPSVLAVRHRRTMGLAVPQPAVVVAVLQVVVVSRMVHRGSGMAKVKLSLSRCGEPDGTEHRKTGEE